jgi:hypothetical protein
MSTQNLRQIVEGLQEDYIPNGEEVDEESAKNLRFRRVREDEIYQCCCQTSRDIQSGPIYCGKLADYVAETVDSEGIYAVVAVCKKHYSHVPKENKTED